MERRNDFHDNNSIRERNEGSWRGNLKGRCHCGEPGGGLGGELGLSTIKTLKHKSLIIVRESALSKGNKWWEEWCEASQRWGDGGMAGREEEQGTLLPGGVWVWEGSGDGRWLHAPWSRLASLHCCHSSICVSETIFAVVQRTWQVGGPALECSGSFSVTLHTHGLCFFRLSPLALKSCSWVCPSSLGVPASCSPSQPLTIFFCFVALH